MSRHFTGSDLFQEIRRATSEGVELLLRALADACRLGFLLLSRTSQIANFLFRPMGRQHLFRIRSLCGRLDLFPPLKLRGAAKF